MTSQKKSWRIRGIANSAKKYIQKQDLKTQEALLIKIECLEYDPFFGDIRKVEGKEDIFRLRADDHRIFYRVFHEDKTMDILLIDKKSGIKRKTIQRL